MQNHGGTVMPKANLSVELEVQKLKRAFSSLGTDEKLVNEVVGSCNLRQRQLIRRKYHEIVGKDLMETIKSKLSGDYGNLVRALFQTPIEMLSFDLGQGIRRSGTYTVGLNEILGCANNAEIKAIKEAHITLEKQSLDQSVTKECKGEYQHLMLCLLRASREEDDPDLIQNAIVTGDFIQLIDHKRLERDVATLRQVLQTKPVDTTMLIEILTARSKHQIRAICELYQKQNNEHLVDTITEKISEPLRTGLNTVVMALLDLRLLLTCQLWESFQGLGTREETLIRIIALRAEIDMEEIKSLYLAKFSESLEERIKSETSGDFRKLLLMVVSTK